jgi:hypothetical protein
VNAPPVDHKSGDASIRYHADAGKPRWTLLPSGSLRQVLAVFEYGARKYEARSWRQVPDGRERYTESLLRHAMDLHAAVEDGGPEALLSADHESGLPILAHLIADGLILLDLARVQR